MATSANSNAEHREISNPARSSTLWFMESPLISGSCAEGVALILDSHLHSIGIHYDQPG